MSQAEAIPVTNETKAIPAEATPVTNETEAIPAAATPVTNETKAIPAEATPVTSKTKNKQNKTTSTSNKTKTIASSAMPVGKQAKEIPEEDGDDEPEERKISDYVKAAKVRNTKLTDLITKKIVEGQGVGSSIKQGLSEKARAKATGIKETFDPLNIAKKLTGGLGAAILGRATGRKQEDIEYFTDTKRKRGNTAKLYSSATKVPTKKDGDTNIDVKKELKNISTAVHTKVAEGQRPRLQKGDGVASVLGKLYNLMKQYHDDDITRMELDRDFKKEKEEKEQRWHEELIDAILGRKQKGPTKPSAKKEKSFNFLDYLKNALKSAFEFLVKTIKNIFKGILKGFTNIVKTAVNVFKRFIEGPIKALKTLIFDAFKKLKDFFEPIIRSAKEALEFIGKNFASLARKVGLTSLAEKVEKAIAKTEEKTVEKIGVETAEKTLAETVEKTGEKAISETALKETEKIAEKTAGKTLLKKIPFLGALAGLAFGAQRAIGGDLTGAALEVASGVVASVPVVGTAASLGIDAYLAARDFGLVGGESKEEPTATPVEEQPKGNTFTETEGGAAIGGMKGIKPKTASIAPTPNVTSETQARTGVDLSNKGQRPTMVNDPRLNMAAPTPPQPNSLSQRVQNVINENNNMKLEQNVAPKNTIIDNSKNIKVGGGSSTERITTDAVPVRNDESTWMRLQKSNYRYV